MSFQACILILVVLAARLLLKKYSGFYTRMLWMLVVIRLLCPVFIETNLSLMPDFTNMQDRINRDGGNISSGFYASSIRFLLRVVNQFPYAVCLLLR